VALTPTDYAPNPNVPFFSFNVGGTDFADEDRPQHLMRFQITMNTNTMGMWTAVFLDPEYTTIEKTLLDNFDKPITIQWGWQHPSSLRSPQFKVWISDFQPRFVMGGSEVTISGFTFEYAKGATQDSRVYPDTVTYGSHKDSMTISDIVNDICTRNDWKADILGTKPIPAFTALDSTDLLGAKFVQNGSDFDFIQSVLAPAAVSEQDHGDYYTFFDPYTSTLSFKPRTKTDPVQTLIFIQDKMNEITNLQPDILIGLWVGLVAAKTTAHGQAPEKSGDLPCGVFDLPPNTQADTATQYDGSKTGSCPEDMQNKLKDPYSCAAEVGYAPAASKEMLENRQKAVWNAGVQCAGTQVQVTIVGHPGTDTIKYLPMQTVDLSVTSPPPDKLPSYLNGNYMIVGVTHLIDQHGYKTQLTLTKNAFDTVGNLEVTNG